MTMPREIKAGDTVRLKCDVNNLHSPDMTVEQTVDTAFEEDEDAVPSAVVVWFNDNGKFKRTIIAFAALALVEDNDED